MELSRASHHQIQAWLLGVKKVSAGLLYYQRFRCMQQGFKPTIDNLFSNFLEFCGSTHQSMYAHYADKPQFKIGIRTWKKFWVLINSCHGLEHVALISAGGICKAQTIKMVVYVCFEALTGYQDKEVYTVISFYRTARYARIGEIAISHEIVTVYRLISYLLQNWFHHIEKSHAHITTAIVTQYPSKSVQSSPNWDYKVININ